MKSLISSCALSLCGMFAVASCYADDKTTPVEKTNRLIVKYAIPVDPAKAVKDPMLAQAAGGRILSTRITAGGASVVDLGHHRTVGEMQSVADTVAGQPGVLYAEPDLIMVHQTIPNDDMYGQQWHYFETAGGINLPSAWDLITTPGEVVVAVVDTGVCPHADLRDNLLPGYDFVSDVDAAQDGGRRDRNADDPGDYAPVGACGTDTRGRPVPLTEESSSWHGTHVAGTIAAVSNNGRGVSGIGRATKILPVRVLGRCGGYTSDITDGMRWAAGLHVPGVPANRYPARVLNLSLGGDGRCSRTYQDAIDDITDVGAVIVVAAGNESRNTKYFSPSSCDGVITVAANRRDGGRAYYSNYGQMVDITAPGGETDTKTDGILSTINAGSRTATEDDYGWYQGTSMAAPHVAGVVGLMYSVNPALKPAEVKHILQDTAREFPRVPRRQCTTQLCGAGIVDATAAIRAVMGTAPVAEVEGPGSQGGLLKKGQPVSGLSIPADQQQNKQLFYRFEVPPEARHLSFTLSGGEGDADLYVRRGRRPTLEKYDCAPYLGGSHECCEFEMPKAGTWYVMIDAYEGFSGATLVADYEREGAIEPGEHLVLVSQGPVVIPDNRSRGITVPIQSQRQGDAGTVMVEVDISHPYVGDLQIVLTYPDGTRKTLKKQDSRQNIKDLKTTYKIDATGHNAAGEWRLTISDHSRKDSGTLNRWRIGFQ